MLKTFDSITQVILILIGLPSFVKGLYHFYFGIDSVIGSVMIGPGGWLWIAVFSFLVTLFASGYYLRRFYVWVYGWINSRTPSYKFKLLSKKIEECIRIEEQRRFVNKSSILNSLTALANELKALDIEAPEVGAGYEEWMSYLILIRPLSLRGDLSEARKVNQQDRSRLKSALS